MKVLISAGGTFIVLIIATISAAADADFKAREQAAEQVASAFITELGQALKTELAEGDPVAAIAVCRDIAPAIANRLSLKNGWKVTRVGTRVRNPLLGTPDAWEQRILQQFAENADAGQSYGKMAYAEIVSEPQGRYFRYMKPIPVGAVCTTCHGSKATIPEPIRRALQAHYPYDRAIGYREGELRGAVSIKQPLVQTGSMD